MKIHPVKHVKGDKNRYCGPSAISIITGMNTGEAARLIRLINGNRPVKGTYTSYVLRVLAMCGLRTHTVEYNGNVDKKDQPTLAQWLKDSVDRRTAGRVYLVVAGHHFQVISGRRYACGRIGGIVSVRDKRVKRRARVEQVIEVKLAHGKKKVSIPSGAAKPKAVTPSAKRDLDKLLRSLGTKGRVTGIGDWKDYEIDPCEQFPNGLNCGHYGWFDTLERVEAAIAEPELIDEDNWISL